jgi:hypothetical protein
MVSFEIFCKIRWIPEKMFMREFGVKPFISPFREPNKKKSLGAVAHVRAAGHLNIVIGSFSI